MAMPNFSNNLLPGERKARELNKLTRWERGNEMFIVSRDFL
jgi:hypothetical protein